MKTYKLQWIGAMIIASILTVSAQDDPLMSREMTLEREYDPTVQDASKINTLPEVKEPTIQKRAIEYAPFTLPVSPSKEMVVLPSGDVKTDLDYHRKRGYLNFGIGTRMNINGDLGYHFIDTHKDLFGFYFTHRSTNGNVKYFMHDEESGLASQGEEVVDKHKIKINDNLASLFYKHQFANSLFKISGDYGNYQYNYYGRGYAIPGTSSLWDPTFVDFLESDKGTRQANQVIKANVGLESKKELDVTYLFDLNYTLLDQKYGAAKSFDGLKEHTINGNIGTSVLLGGTYNARVCVGGMFNYFKYSLPSELEELYENYFEGTIAPAFTLEGGSWDLRLGAKLMFLTGDNKKIFVSPDITFDVKMANKTMLYLKAGGELRSNSVYQLMQENRYATTQFALAPSRIPLDVKGGIKSGVIPGGWFDIFAGYTIIKDDYFYAPGRIYNDAHFMRISTFDQIESKRFYAGASLKYNYRDLFEMRLKGVYNDWKSEFNSEDVTTYSRPEMEINAGVSVKPIKPLNIALDYYLGTGIYARIFPSDLKMNNINELNLTASWKLNDMFGIYLKGSNLFNQKYELYYGYPMQGINVMAGININF